MAVVRRQEGSGGRRSSGHVQCDIRSGLAFNAGATDGMRLYLVIDDNHEGRTFKEMQRQAARSYAARCVLLA